MIKIEEGNLYFKKYHALKDINIKIKKGERVAIVGSNGSGKSTLVDIITGIKKLDSGKVTIDKDLQNMGVQFQSKNFPHGLKVKDLLSFYLEIFEMKQTDKRVVRLLKQFKLDEKLNVNIKKMSGGQQQKLNIMIALLNNPDLLIMDELVTALDIVSQKEIIHIVSDIVKENKKLTLILVSHNETEILKLTNRLITLNAGEIMSDMLVKEILKKHKTIDKYFQKMEGNDE